MIETANLLWAIVFSSIGFGYFRYGKKQQHKVAYYTGISLMIYPYFISGFTPLLIVGIALMLLPYLSKRW